MANPLKDARYAQQAFRNARQFKKNPDAIRNVMGMMGGWGAGPGAGKARDAAAASAVAGGRRFLGRRGIKYGVGAGVVLGAYGVGRSSGANRNSVSAPSTGIYGI